MSVSFISCPNCNTMLLSDTTQCPSCRHILGRGQLVETGPVESRSDVASTGMEDPCPSCGEMVRHGLVRCWNCSTFMRSDIAESYRAMQQSPAPVTYSRLPGDENTGSSPTYQFEESAGGSFSEGWVDEDLLNLPDIADDDLLLAPRIEPEPEEDDFETAPGFEPRADESANTETTALPASNSAAATDAVGDISSNGSLPSNGDSGTTSWITGDPMTSEDPAVSPDIDPSTAPSTPVEHEKPPASVSSGVETVEHHSIATAGDVLLKAALEQEADTSRRRKQSGRRVGTGRLLVFCPNGHRIEVSERHRGRTGRCPKCKSPFFVPAEDWGAGAKTPGEDGTPSDDTEGGTPDSASAEVTGQELRWIEEVRLHKVDPTKLKLKAGSLAGEFQPIDLGFSDDNILMVSLPAGKAGLFGGKKNSPDEARETIRTELRQGKSFSELSAEWSDVINADNVSGIAIVQPAQDDYSSMFAGIPVFGEGRIAVRIPKAEGESLLRFLSFELSMFRQLAQNLSEMYDKTLPGDEVGIPMSDSFVEKTCHYSEQTLAVLQNVVFYQKDAGFDVKLIGRECQKCGLVVSEESRKKEKIGGAGGKGIAKAKCPKCRQPFGEISLFTIDVVTRTGAETSDDGTETTDDNGNSTDDEAAT